MHESPPPERGPGPGRVLLGPEIVERLLPHRRPLMLVDCIEAYARAPRPSLRAARHLSLNEPVFDGHFPGQPLWPGVYTIEGLAQSCGLLAVLAGLERAVAAAGHDPDGVIPALRELQRDQRALRPPRPLPPPLSEALAGCGRTVGLLVAVDVKLTEPVYAGQRLSYSVAEAAVAGLPTSTSSSAIRRFEVEAQVEGGPPVARGHLLLACAPAAPGP